MCNHLKWFVPLLAATVFCLSQISPSRADDAAKNGSVNGSVVDTTGAAVADIKVRLVGAEKSDTAPGGYKPVEHNVVATATTDKDGKFTMADVPAGEYFALAADKTREIHGRERVTVTADKASTVTVTVKPNGHK